MREHELPTLYAVARPTPKLPSMPDRVRAIILDEARRAGLSPHSLIGRSHERAPTLARHQAWIRIMDLHGRPFSTARVGAWFSNRSGPTVRAAIKWRAEKMIPKAAAE